MEKYEFSEQDANDMADFLAPILDFVPEKRPTAAQLLTHPWINAGPLTCEPRSQPEPTQPSVDGVSEKQKKEKEERDAMAVGIGNIAIDGAAKVGKDSPAGSKVGKAVVTSSR